MKRILPDIWSMEGHQGSTSSPLSMITNPTVRQIIVTLCPRCCSINAETIVKQSVVNYLQVLNGMGSSHKRVHSRSMLHMGII